MNDEEMIMLTQFYCSARCGKVLGWHDENDPLTQMATMICDHCMNNPDEIVERLAT